MPDLPKMNTKIMAETVKPTGSGTIGGTPGKASGNDTNDKFVMEGVDSADNTETFPAMQLGWNVNHTPYGK